MKSSAMTIRQAGCGVQGDVLYPQERKNIVSREENIAAQERMAEAVNTGNLDIFDEIMLPDAVDHDPAPDQGPGPEGFKQFFTTLRTAFPDLEVSPEHMVATDDDVALAYTARGTHDGDFLGVSPTGRRIEVRGLQIWRFENGKMAERWGSSDELGIFQQIGAIGDPGEEQDKDKGMVDKLKDKMGGQ